MRRIVLLAMTLTLAACGRDHQPTEAPSITGSYQLTTVDGQALPLNVIDLGAYKADLVSGSLTLNADGSYARAFDLRIDDSGNIRTTGDDDAGQWTVVGDAITLASTRGISVTGTVSPNGMTLQSSTRSLVYHR